MEMHKRLSRKALERAFRDLPFDAATKEQIMAELPKQAIITPFPDYGPIVHNVPEIYQFAEIRARMDGERYRYLSFFAESLAQYYYHRNLDSIPASEPGPDGFFWNNGFFGGGDARTLYAMIAWARPTTFLEIGVGNSTRIARKAIREFQTGTRIVSVDPTPRASITDYSDEIITSSVTNVDIAVFRALEPGDILFIDGSHVCNVGTDVPFFFLNVFPVLKPGVIVHIHDIFLPWEYPEAMRVRHYNEQHMLGAMLANSSSWRILMPVHYMARTDAVVPPRGGGSFWIEKLA
jgi:hypothetical protein